MLESCKSERRNCSLFFPACHSCDITPTRVLV